MEKLRVAIAQVNPTVGALNSNKIKILSFLKKIKLYKPDIVIFPELIITGYPPEDLILKPHFRSDSYKTLMQIVKQVRIPAVIVLGYPEEKKGKIYNSAGIIYQNKLIASYQKINLPNYGVFDEKRYFTPGEKPLLLKINQIGVGITICEDIWTEYGPYVLESLSGAQVIINISASPYYYGKIYHRMGLLKNISKRFNLKIAYVNLVGGQDELVFDGASMIAEAGEIKAVAKQFEEDILYYDFEFREQKEAFILKGVRKVRIPLDKSNNKPPITSSEKNILNLPEEIYKALLLGTKDYVRKNGFKKVIIGLSGGIDSSLTAVIAVDALGKQNVIGVSMPSLYSSADSIKDAIKVAQNLKIKLLNIPITKIYNSYLDSLKPLFGKLPFDKTEENIQARIRGNLLMALSNKFGWLVLTTGNKSEVSTGYCTLYGDMAGGFAVIKDVPKTMVYELVKWRNQKEGKIIIPVEVLKKPPSAELKPGQKDQDTLPDYKILDQIIYFYIEKDKSFDEIVKAGFRKNLVKKVIKMIDKNEYKRRQAPPGIKISPKAFGKDRRMPITNGYFLR